MKFRPAIRNYNVSIDCLITNNNMIESRSTIQTKLLELTLESWKCYPMSATLLQKMGKL